MPFNELVSLAFENLSRRLGRVALTAVGVVIGTAAVVMLVSVAAGLQRSTQEQIESFGDLTRIDVYQAFGGGRFGGFSEEEETDNKIITDQTIADIYAILGVDAVIPSDYMQAAGTIKAGRQETFASIIGIGTNDLTTLGLEAQEGSLFLTRGTAIVGYQVPNFFSDPNLRPGQPPPPPPNLMNQPLQLVLQKVDTQGNVVERVIQLRVVGIIAETQNEPDYSIYMPLSDVTAINEWSSGQRINRSQTGYGQLIVKVDNADNVIEIADQITEMGYQASTLQQFLQGFNTFALIIQVVFGGIGAIALLVAAIGIANTMTMAILERTREIGLMKAIGATNRDVLSIFLGEAAGIGLLGGIGGIIIGWVASRLLNTIAITLIAQEAAQSGGEAPSVIVYTPPWLIIFALLFSVFIGLVSGLYPALRAATMVPVSALKYE